MKVGKPFRRISTLQNRETLIIVGLFRSVLLLSILSIFSAEQMPGEPPNLNAGTIAQKDASNYLANVCDQFQKKLWVYSDGDAAGNHFVVLGRMSYWDDLGDAADGKRILPDMDFECTNGQSNATYCIKASFKASSQRDWGGWYFMNGYLVGAGTNSHPIVNWGTCAKAGQNLTGAQQLSFWARGETGHEQVDFFVGGVGRNAANGNPASPYPCSLTKKDLGIITLSIAWQQYQISLGDANLSYVLGGFGWTAREKENGRHRATFYLAKIGFDLTADEQAARLSAPHFLVSYEVEASTNPADRILKNTAYVYDNALALMAFLAVGDRAHAKVIADAFVAAQQADRLYTDGSIRNAYQGGDLFTAPGWVANGESQSARLPGYMQTDANLTSKWQEDCYNDSRDTGNAAWAMLGLLAYHQTVFGSTQPSKYLDAAERLGNWVATNCGNTNGSAGFTGGQYGWEGSDTKRAYMATEHNIDLYAAFTRLYHITKEDIWAQRADSAKEFVNSMWDGNEGKFWTGNDIYGVGINKSVIPLDIQAWALLSLGTNCKPYLKSLEYAEGHMKNGEGYDFSKVPKLLQDGTTNNDENGIWYEGTAHIAVAYRLMGQFTDDPQAAKKKADTLLAFLKDRQNDDGSMPAADKKIWTGFMLPDGANKWYYFNRKHIGATAWLIFAETGTNPYWLGEK